MRPARWLPLLMVLALAVPACARLTAAEPEQGTIEVALVDYAFEPSTIRLPAGQEVRVVLRNDGSHLHEFMIGRHPRPNADYLQDPAVEPFEVGCFEGVKVKASGGGMAMNFEGMKGMDGMEGMDMGQERHAGAMVQLQPGQTHELVFTVPRDKTGRWEFGCFQEDGFHYADGMRGTLLVG